MIRTHDIRLLSLDLFDTALLRQTRSETGRFLATVERFLAAGDEPEPAHNLLLARMLAANGSYAMRRKREATSDPAFRDIVETASRLVRRPALRERYMQAEIASEHGDVIANPLLGPLRQRFPNLTVVFLSDMYLTAGELRPIVQAVLPDWPRPRIFSSADGNGSKAAGDLFEHVARRMHVPPPHALHLGDTLESDCLSARRQGWHALHLPLPQSERAERERDHARILAAVGLRRARLMGGARFTP